MPTIFPVRPIISTANANANANHPNQKWNTRKCPAFIFYEQRITNNQQPSTNNYRLSTSNWQPETGNYQLATSIGRTGTKFLYDIAACAANSAIVPVMPTI
jgi:hypothetical protein